MPLPKLLCGVWPGEVSLGLGMGSALRGVPQQSLSLGAVGTGSPGMADPLPPQARKLFPPEPQV